MNNDERTAMLDKLILGRNEYPKTEEINELNIFTDLTNDLSYDFIGLELYYKEKLSQNGLKAQIVNMLSVMNEHYDILNYPIDVKTAAVSDNQFRNLLNELSYDVVILNIPQLNAPHLTVNE